VRTRIKSDKANSHKEGGVNLKKLVTEVGLIILAVVSVGTCANKTPEDQPESAEPAEIREYQGTKLSSANDFRENSIKGPQYIDRDAYRLTISGLVDSTRAYRYDEIVKRPSQKRVVTLNCVEGWSVTILWEGVLVRDLIKEAGVDKKANTVIFHAHDGYSSSFPLRYIMENDIMMAHRMNGLTIPPQRGFPFELVAENKWGYKWVKWITKIELSDNDEYRGFWESRGYSNDGDLDKGFFEEP
jgi:DMSO/TMAO reductase YedYZ molybdopterin-dependent catalytic subunit